jgi:5-methylcytosine-specific restriction endonuclease McrA
MPERLVAAARAWREELVDFAPEACSGADCAILAEELAQTAKACAAASARAAARAAECGAQRGFGDAKDWLGRISGTTAGQAKAVLDTAQALEECPQTKEAVVSGQLSLAQGAEIAKTEAACPGTESELVGLAKGSTLGVLRDKARSRRLRSMDVEELHARQRSARELRHWIDDLGMVRGTFALAPLEGVPIVNRLEAETDRIRRLARREGSDEPRAAHGADALVKMFAGTGTGKADRADMVIVYDRTAALSGAGEEKAHVVGGGPIPVAQARRLAERCFLKAVIHDGTRIETIKHLGRKLPAELRTAIGLGDPPGFEGFICIDCGKRYGIQRDHLNPVANGGLTSYDNLRGRCWDCHEKKTEADRKAGLLRGKRKETGEPP